MAKKKYSIGFRLYAEVKLTDDELQKVIEGNAEPIAKLIEAGKIHLGGGDSYIPGTWLADNGELPQSVKDTLTGDDIELNL